MYMYPPLVAEQFNHCAKVSLLIGKSASIPYTTRFRGPDESAVKMVSEVDYQ